jgi:hypothetical protein
MKLLSLALVASVAVTKKLCGRAHGQEMQDCIKSSLDLNKFSADCKTKLSRSAKPSG